MEQRLEFFFFKLMSKNTISGGGQRGKDLHHVDRLKVSPSSVVSTLQRTNTKNSKQIFPEEELRGHSPNFPIHMSVSDSFIPRSICLFCCRKYMDRSWEHKIAHRHMNVEIGTEAAQFPEKTYKNGIFVAV
jgi:hypothetical protein